MPPMPLTMIPPVPLATLVASNGALGGSNGALGGSQGGSQGALGGSNGGLGGSNEAFGGSNGALGGSAMYYSYNGKNYATLDDVNVAITAATGLPQFDSTNNAFPTAAGMPIIGSDDKAVTADSGMSSVIANETPLHQKDQATVEESAKGKEVEGAGQVFN